MKFLVDAHLPPSLCALLQAAGHDTLHTSQLAARNQTRDQVINELSLKDPARRHFQGHGFLLLPSPPTAAPQAPAHPHRQYGYARTRGVVSEAPSRHYTGARKQLSRRVGPRRRPNRCLMVSQRCWAESLSARSSALGPLGGELQAVQMRAVGFDEAGAEGPALIELRDLQQERIPACVQSHVHLV
jgi:hypothetical protein